MRAGRYAKRKIMQFVVIILIVFLFIFVYKMFSTSENEETGQIDIQQQEQQTQQPSSVNVQADDEKTDLKEILSELEKSADFVNVSIKTSQGKVVIPLEIYVYQVVESWLADCEKPAEYLKVLCVLCRTEIIRVGEENNCLIEVPSSFLSSTYTYDYTRQAFLTKENLVDRNLLQAVYGTKGVIVTYDAAPVFCPFFAISAGMTRGIYEKNGAEVYPYLQSVGCDDDYQAKEYLQKTSISMNKFLYTLQEYLEKTSINIPDMTKTEIFKIHLTQYNDSNYVKEMVLNDEPALTISGDDVRDCFSLPSSAFSIQILENNEELVIVTRGVGHGIGLSLSEAEIMADNGNSYQDIICYFFKDVKFDICA